MRHGVQSASCKRPDTACQPRKIWRRNHQTRHPNQHSRRAVDPYPEPASQVPRLHTPQIKAAMATPIAAATEAVAQQLPRKLGTKQIFLYESRSLIQPRDMEKWTDSPFL
jgi:hypothetical protein